VPRSVHQAAKLAAALLRVAGVTAGPAESNGSLPPGLGLTAKNRDQLRNPTPGNRVWATFTFFTNKTRPGCKASVLAKSKTTINLYSDMRLKRWEIFLLNSCACHLLCEIPLDCLFTGCLSEQLSCQLLTLIAKSGVKHLHLSYLEQF